MSVFKALQNVPKFKGSRENEITIGWSPWRKTSWKRCDWRRQSKEELRSQTPSPDKSDCHLNFWEGKARLLYCLFLFSPP
jgi:hypothetical protein